MTAADGRGVGVPPWTLAVAAMFSVQLSSALSVDLIASIGSAGTAWLRRTFGAVIFLAIARPRLSSIRRRDVSSLVGLGVATGGERRRGRSPQRGRPGSHRQVRHAAPRATHSELAEGNRSTAEHLVGHAR